MTTVAVPLEQNRALRFGVFAQQRDGPGFGDAMKFDKEFDYSASSCACSWAARKLVEGSDWKVSESAS